MEYQEVITLLETPNELVQQLRHTCPSFWNENYKRQYDPRLHDVMDKDVRKDREVFKPSGETDAKGVPKKNADGSPHTVKSILPVIRVAVPFEKKTIKVKSVFTAGKISLKATYTAGSVEERLYTAVLKLWNDLKLQYEIKTALKYRMAETEVAMRFFKDEDDRLRMNMMAPTLGYTLRPVYNAILNMVAFGIEYTLIKGGKQVNHLDFYVDKDSTLTRFSDEFGVWEQLGPVVKLGYGKMPIIYGFQTEPECNDAKSARERYEGIISDLGEQNKRTGFPKMFATGKVSGVPAGEPGQFFAGEVGSDLKMVTSDNAPKSIELELTTVKSEMHFAVGTPDLSFEAMKNLGDVSAATLKRLLIGLYIEAQDEQEGEFGKFVQRTLNFLKAAAISDDAGFVAARDLFIYPEFERFSIEDATDRVELATSALAVTSLKNAFKIAGLSDDPYADYEEYVKEQAAKVVPVVAPAVV